eukprot:scaffold42803_cov78-Cyclotella_meneghiniana.AAC.1
MDGDDGGLVNASKPEGIYNLSTINFIAQMIHMIVNQSASDEATPTAESTALQCSSDHDIRSPYYCEENVWRIVYRHLHLNMVKDKSSSWQYNVVFISNKLRCCPMYMQRAVPNHPGEY